MTPNTTGQAAAALGRIAAGKPAHPNVLARPGLVRVNAGGNDKLTPAIAANSSRPLSRVQVVAHAVASDPKCKGKASLALAMLADDELAGVTGLGLVKLLARLPASAEIKGGLQAPVATQHGAGNWSKVIAELNARQGL